MYIINDENVEKNDLEKILDEMERETSVKNDVSLYLWTSTNLI